MFSMYSLLLLYLTFLQVFIIKLIKYSLLVSLCINLLNCSSYFSFFELVRIYLIASPMINPLSEDLG